MATAVSVIIPTRGRPRKVAACVRALANQTLAPQRYEVLVGLDGPDPETAQIVRDAWADADPDRLHVITCAASFGPNPVRNRLMQRARGRSIVALNDDVVPEPDLLAVHHAEQRRAHDAGRPALIVGRCPWIRPDPADDRLFDRLIRETSMVFFYDRMDDAEPDRDWGFRHAWSLNLSLPAAAAVEAGGWAEVHGEYGHDDLELAWRLGRDHGMPVLYRPAAIAAHDHRINPGEYLQREFRLGRSAWYYAVHHADFARDLFGRDLTSQSEIADFRWCVERQRAAALEALASFERLVGLPATAAVSIERIYRDHLPLKRWMWACGLVAAADESGGTDSKPAGGRRVVSESEGQIQFPRTTRPREAASLSVPPSLGGKA